MKDWKGYVSKSGCKVLQPIIKELNRGCDDWEIECYCGNKFISRPYWIKAGTTKSCKCLFRQKILEVNNNKKKYNYYGYINEETKIQILRPVNEVKNKGYDEWIALCPRHIPPKEFITAPNDVVNGRIKSCKCLARENSSKIFKEFNEKRRINNGLKSTEYLMKKTELIRQMIYYPLRSLVIKLDNNECVRCKNKNNLTVHHIFPFSSINLDNEIDLRKMFDLSNLITLCDDDENNDCHYIAHNKDWYDINLNIQKELLQLTNNRIISQNILDEYDKIIKTKVEPQLINYLNNMSDKNE
jgi:hypothetical protein